MSTARMQGERLCDVVGCRNIWAVGFGDAAVCADHRAQLGAPRYRSVVDGVEIVGCVQGCGGLVVSLERLEKAKRIAAKGRAHGLYEPAKGCVSVFTEYSAASNGPASIVPVSALVGGA